MEELLYPFGLQRHAKVVSSFGSRDSKATFAHFHFMRNVNVWFTKNVYIKKVFFFYSDAVMIGLQYSSCEKKTNDTRLHMCKENNVLCLEPRMASLDL